MNEEKDYTKTMKHSFDYVAQAIEFYMAHEPRTQAEVEKLCKYLRDTVATVCGALESDNSYDDTISEIEDVLLH